MPGDAVALTVSLFFNHLAFALSDCLVLSCLTALYSSVRRPWYMWSDSIVQNAMIVGLIRFHWPGVNLANLANNLSSFGSLQQGERHAAMSSNK